MPTVCKKGSQVQFEIQQASNRRVVADFEGGDITSDGGALLVRQVAKHTNKIGVDEQAFAKLFTQWYIQTHQGNPPAEIILDLNATDDPLHGRQEGRFFHGYYYHYCYLPLYVFAGDQLLWAQLRPADIDAAKGSVEAVARISHQAHFLNAKRNFSGDKAKFKLCSES